MSRHRYVKDLIDEDYYDDYDDYDDDYLPPSKSQKAKPKQPTKPPAKKTPKKTPVAPKTKATGSLAVVAPPKKPPASSGTTTSTTTTTTTTTTSTTTDTNNSTPNKRQLQLKAEREQIMKELASKQSQQSYLTMVVLGHVDAGKSTLMGQVLVQLGQARKPRNTTNDNFNLAFLLDEVPEEQERGVTMEVATKHIATDNHAITILDAPGHADFIPAMITGAATADVCILVVAATPNEFEAGWTKGGQTKEHLILARGLGVTQVLVAVNKLDVVDWDQTRYTTIQDHIKPFLKQQGFAEKRIRFVPISGLAGINVHANTCEALLEWYNGPTLLQAMNEFLTVKRHVDKPLRVTVTDAYGEGKNVMVRGRIAEGLLLAGEKLLVLPIGDETTVGRLELPPTCTHDSNFAAAGDTVDIALQGIDLIRVSVGCVLSHPQNPPTIHKQCQAKILVMEGLGVPIIRGAQVLFHMHSLDVPAVLNKLIAVTKRDGSVKKERLRALTGGVSATVEITLSDRICMETFADCRALGRFVLRRSGQTIAVGIIDKILI